VDSARATAAFPGIAAAAIAFFVPVYFARQKPGYSHVRHTISELAEVGSPIQTRVSYLGFVPIALLIWCFLGMAAEFLPPDSSRAVWMLSLVCRGYFGGALFPCDPGAPVFGSLRNQLHNLFGGFEYIGAGLGFIALSEQFEGDASWVSLSGFSRLPALSCSSAS
jgi:hypothetical protein